MPNLLQSAKLNGHDPYAYLKYLMTRLPTQPYSQHADIERLVDQIRRLTPKDHYHQVLHSQALSTSEDILKSRWVAITSIGSSISNIQLVVLWFWLVIIFFGFGLLSPHHSLMIGLHFVVAISTAAAIFLMMELEGPFDGFIHVSGDPMRFVNQLLQQ